MFDTFILKYRFVIGGILLVIILVGSGFLVWDKFASNNKNQENQTIADLKNQNNQLRQELSNQSQQQVAGISTTASNSVESIGTKININTADVAELDKIPNIGPARAADVIAYRTTKGGFKTIEEMKNIKGIGDKTFESMKDLITVGN